jgi:ATP-binding cassette subfamily B protein
MHGEQDWLERFFKLSANATMSNFEVEIQTALSVSLSNFIMQSSALAVVAISAPLVINQTLSSGALIASMFLIWRVLAPMQAIYTNITRITRLRNATTQINALMQIETESKSQAPANNLHIDHGDMQFNRISYRYPDSTESALGGVSFSVKSGQLVCISGGNGDGKTSLLKILLRMLPIQNGAILLDGVDIRQFNPIRLRRYFGYATQEPQFFRATIAQNLRLTRPDASDAEVEAVLKNLNAWDELNRLKDGLNTRLGDNRQLLGSGLMQKVNLARAFLTDAPMLLLDEPSAHLSSNDLAALVAHLTSLKSQKTILLMTNQSELLELADQKFVLNNGNLSVAAS